MKPLQRFLAAGVVGVVCSAQIATAGDTVGDDVIAAQRAALAAATAGTGFGPQSPRDIESFEGANANAFQAAPDYTSMHLCNIHFHEGAEHRGGDFRRYAGNGDGKGYNSGFLFSGALSDAEKAPVDFEIGSQKKGGLQAGDTIEQHYVHTTAVITPGPTLGSCLAESIMNPQLRVEAVVFVIVNDENAGDMVELNKVEMVNGYWQAPNLPAMLGDPVQYAGSTTGPAYNEKGSPLQVSWSVRPRVMKVSASSVAKWLEGNEFDEIKAHAVRNLVLNPDLLSEIGG